MSDGSIYMISDQKAERSKLDPEKDITFNNPTQTLLLLMVRDHFLKVP